MRTSLILFVLIDFPMRIDRISMILSILYLRGHMMIFLNYDAFLACRCVFIFANSGDSDEMPQLAAFHLCLHCLQKYLFIGIQN